MPKRVWNEEKIKVLKRLYGSMPNKDLCVILEIKYDTLLKKASELKLKYGRVAWTSELDDVLIRLYPSGNLDEIFLLIEGVTLHSIRHRAKKLGLRRESFWWTDEEMHILNTLYPHYTNKYLSEEYLEKRTPVQIRCMGIKHGLRKTKKKGVKWYDPEKMLRQLEELSIHLGRTPVHHELIEHGLPSQKSYERYFGGYRKACEQVGILPNTSIFGRPSRALCDKAGELCLSHTEVFITNFIIDAGVPYEKELFYKDVFSIKDFGARRMDWFIPSKKLAIEYFGMMGNKMYEKKVKKKLELVEKYGINMVSIYPDTLSLETLENMLL